MAKLLMGTGIILLFSIVAHGQDDATTNPLSLLPTLTVEENGDDSNKQEADVAPLETNEATAEPIKIAPLSTNQQQNNDEGKDDVNAVQVNILSSLDASVTGILTEENGGFSLNLWNGLDENGALSAIGTLPAHYINRDFANMARRLLLTAAPVSARANIASANEKQEFGLKFLYTRAQKLQEMGLYEDAILLLDALPGELQDDIYDEKKAILFLQTDQLAKACGLLQSKQDIPYSDEYFWQKLFILCLMENNKKEEAEFSLSILEDEGVLKKDFIYAAMRVLNIIPFNKDGMLSMAQSGDAVVQYLKYKIGEMPDYDANGDNGVADLLFYLKGQNISADEKIDIVDRLYAYHVFDIQDVIKYYGETPFDEARFKLLMRANYPYGISPNDRAILYQAIKEHRLGSARANIIARLVKFSLAGRDTQPILQLVMPYLQEIKPDIDLKNYADLFAILHLYNGDDERAKAWARINDIARDTANIDEKYLSLHSLFTILTAQNEIANNPTILPPVMDGPILENGAENNTENDAENDAGENNNNNDIEVKKTTILNIDMNNIPYYSFALIHAIVNNNSYSGEGDILFHDDVWNNAPAIMGAPSFGNDFYIARKNIHRMIDNGYMARAYIGILQSQAVVKWRDGDKKSEVQYMPVEAASDFYYILKSFKMSKMATRLLFTHLLENGLLPPYNE
jgi:hypothetical protein